MKFLDIITEETNRPLGHPFYRKILNIISKKFNIKRLDSELKDTNKDEELDNLLRNVWPLDMESQEFVRPVYMRHWLEDTFKLDKKDLANILYLLYRNTQVDDFLNDPLITNEPFWVTKIYYYKDEIVESTEEETTDCERCEGGGYDHEECEECDGCGNITTDDGGSEECDDCDAGILYTDCSSCGGDCQFTSETEVATLWRNEMLVTSEEKIPTPKEGQEFREWYVNNRHKFDIISDENHDSQKVELKYEGEQTELEKERGTVDYVNQRKIDNEEEIKKFSKFWIV